MSEHPVSFFHPSSPSSQPCGGGADRVILPAEWLKSITVLSSAWPVAVYSQQVLPTCTPLRCTSVRVDEQVPQRCGVATGAGRVCREVRNAHKAARPIASRIGRRAAHCSISGFDAVTLTRLIAVLEQA